MSKENHLKEYQHIHKIEMPRLNEVSWLKISEIKKEKTKTLLKRSTILLFLGRYSKKNWRQWQVPVCCLKWSRDGIISWIEMECSSWCFHWWNSPDTLIPRNLIQLQRTFLISGLSVLHLFYKYNQSNLILPNNPCSTFEGFMQFQISSSESSTESLSL